MNETTKVINDLRKMNKDKWYFITLMDSKDNLIEVKGYNTWLQILRINGINHASPMDISVKAFLEHIERAIQ